MADENGSASMSHSGSRVSLGPVELAEARLNIAQLETQVRGLVMELMAPSIEKTTLVVQDLDALKKMSHQHERSLHDVQLALFKALEQTTMIHTFREDLSKWDILRMEQEAVMTERTESMQQKIDSFKYSLEQKESALHHLQRSVDRIASEINRNMEEQETERDDLENRVDELNRRMAQLGAELEVRLASQEQRHNSLCDELWGEELGLAKVSGELTKTNSRFQKLEDSVQALLRGKAETSALEHLKEQVTRMVQDNDCELTSLKYKVGEVVNDVTEHFRTAVDTISAHNATFVKEVRDQYQGELAHVAKLRDEVEGFIYKMEESVTSLDGRVLEAVAKSEALAAEAREELEELHRRRKRDKTSADNELKALKKRLGGVFDSSDAVMQGVEHLYKVLQSILESDLIQCELEQQDEVDRQAIALMGIKDDDTALVRNKQAEPQRPRPECRAKTAPGGAKPYPNGKPGSMSARGAQEPVVRLDGRCISCSGQSPLVLSAFKMACLHYTPSPVDHHGRPYERKELMLARQRLLQAAHGALTEGPKSAGHAGKGGLSGTEMTTSAEDSGGEPFSEYAAIEARLSKPRKGSDAVLRLPNVSAALGFPTPRAVLAT